MALQIIRKTNSKLKSQMPQPLRRLLFNSIIQPHFDNVCSGIYLNLNKSLRIRLNLHNRALSINDLFEQSINSTILKFSINKTLAYMNDAFKQTGHPNTNARASFLRLNQTLRKINHGQKYFLKSTQYLEQPSRLFESSGGT